MANKTKTDLARSYRWFSKDWQADERVFELGLSSRGLYREFIDRAYATENAVKVDFRLWSRMFNCTTEQLEEIVSELAEVGLIKIADGLLSVPSINKRLQAIEYGRKGNQARRQQNDDSGAENSPEEEAEASLIPTEDEVINYFKSNGYSEAGAKAAFSYYNASVKSNRQRYWRDSRDNPVKNWKQKVRAVWFKDEYKEQQQIRTRL